MNKFDFFKTFNYIRVTLAILVVCSIFISYGIFQILIRHNRIINNNAKNGMDFISIVQGMGKSDQQCKDRISIIEEQMETLFEFHQGEKSFSSIKVEN